MNWPQVQLAPVLAKVVRGVTFSQSDATSEPVAEGIPVLRAGNIQQKLVIDKDLVWVARSFVSNDQLLQRNDIVVCTSSGSGALVGKSAILETDFEGTWGAFNAVIRCNPDVLKPQYLAYWLSSKAFHAWKERQVQGANIQNIRQSALETIRLPLPTLLEQQRIVDVIGQSEAVAKAKNSICELIDRLVSTAYWQHFGGWYTADGLRDPVRIADYLADTQYGVSEAMEERGTHAVLRMNSLTTSGWLDLSDLKYANLTKKDADNTGLKHGDLIFNRTNSRELVGKCAIWRETTGLFSFASYLIRLRLRDGMLPEYLWATLNSAYGKYRLLNAAKQAVSMANVSPTDLGRITVPLPPLPLQEKFAQFVRQVESLRTNMLEKLEAFEELRSLVAQQALIGELTADWRDQHYKEITTAAQHRDTLLRERGIKPTRAEPAAEPSTESEAEPTARPWLRAELSDFQRAVLAAFLTYPEQPLFTEVATRFEAFCTEEQVASRLADFDYSPNRIGRTLSLLADLGLVKQVSLPRTNPLTGEREYLKAFRPLRPGEQTRAADVALLIREIERRRNPSKAEPGA